MGIVGLRLFTKGALGYVTSVLLEGCLLGSASLSSYPTVSTFVTGELCASWSGSCQDNDSGLAN